MKKKTDEKEQAVLDVNFRVCTWRMPFDINPLDEKIAKLQKIRDAFVERWSDKETGKIIPTVKAVYNLGVSLDEWEIYCVPDPACGFSNIVDEQMSRFTTPYSYGKRPLPKGRYE